MVGFRFKCFQPAAQPTSGYASRISRDSWSQYEGLIRQLHSRGTTRDDILDILINEHQFQPSIGQLRDQMARWGLRSYRRNKIKGASNIGNASFNSSTSSIVSDASEPNHTTPCSSHMYASIPDNAFDQVWPQDDVGTLQYQDALEAEILAEMLFLGRRYVAAFKIYSSIYYEVPFFRGLSDIDRANTRFRAFLGCLRSCGNKDQRMKIVSIAEQEMRNSSANSFCNLDEVNLIPEVEQSRSPLMAQSHEREHFRHTLIATGCGTNVSGIATRMRIDEGRREVLRWCYDRLNAYEFVAIYNDQLRRPGSGLAGLSCDGCQTMIYWYLVVDAFNGRNRTCPPRFTIRHPSGRSYTLSICETFSLVAAMLNSHAWLSFTDRGWLERIQEWAEALMADSRLFDDVVSQTINSTIVPTFTLRMNKTNSDMSATVNGYPAYCMPTIDVLKILSAWLREENPMLALSGYSEASTNVNSFYSNDFVSSSLEALMREYSGVIKSYVNDNRAYGTSYQLNEKPRLQSLTSSNSISARSKSFRLRSVSGRPQLTGPSDPTLTLSMRGSIHGSFRSFQSIHRRTQIVESEDIEQDFMNIDTRLSVPELMNVDSSGSLELNRQYLVGVN